MTNKKFYKKINGILQEAEIIEFFRYKFNEFVIHESDMSDKEKLFDLSDYLTGQLLLQGYKNKNKIKNALTNKLRQSKDFNFFKRHVHGRNALKINSTKFRQGYFKTIKLFEDSYNKDFLDGITCALKIFGYPNSDLTSFDIFERANKLTNTKRMNSKKS